MTLLKLTSLAVLAASCGCALADAAGHDLPPPGPMMKAPMMHGPMQGPGPGAEVRRPGPPFLHGVVLDQEQEDKIFAIRHAQEPQRREQARILRQSREALHALAVSGQYDEGKAVALAKSIGAAMAALALLDARTEAKMLALMTPEQWRQADSDKTRPHPIPGQ